MVLVLIGLMAALIAPRLTGSLPKLRLQTAAKKISAALRYARSQAVTQNQTYTAVFDFERNRLYVVDRLMSSGPDALDPLNAADETGLRKKTYDLPREVKLKSASSGQDEVTSGAFNLFFYSTGGSSGGTVTLVGEKEKEYLIKVEPIIGSVELVEI